MGLIRPRRRLGSAPDGEPAGGRDDALQQRTVRLYGVFLLASGLAKLAQMQLPGYDASAPRVLAAVAAAAALVGAVLIVAAHRRPLPWWAVAVPAGLGLVLVGYGLPQVAVPPDRWLTAAVLFVGIFVLLGLTQPQRMVVAFVPVLAVVHVLPYAPDVQAMYAATVTGLMVVAVCALVGLMLSHTVGGLEQARAHSTTRAQARERLSGAPARIARAGPQQATAVTADIAREVFDAETAWVITERGNLRSPQALPSTGADDDRWQPDAERLLAVVADALRQRSLAVADGSAGRRLVAIPLVAGDHLHGTAVLATTADPPLTPVGRYCAELFSHQAGVALDQHERHEQLQHTASHDALTGVGNRRHADQLLDTLAPGDTLCLFDLDRFKRINDTHGHQTGDAILEAFGAHLRRHLRQPDEIARYGGDEFVAVLRPLDAGEVDHVIARLETRWSDPTGCEVTFTVGTAAHTADASPEHTLAAADADLYAAKHHRHIAAAVDDTMTGIDVVLGAVDAHHHHVDASEPS